MLFSGSDAVIFQFDIHDFTFQELRDNYYEYLRQIIALRKTLGEQYLIYVLAHKIDEIKSDRLESLKRTVQDGISAFVTDHFPEIPVSIHFTSLREPFLNPTYDIVRNIVIK